MMKKYVKALRLYTQGVKNNGITLIALVITIIILLILAGISISALTNTGLFEKAKEARKKSDIAQKQEYNSLNEYKDQIDQYISNSNRNNGENTGDKILGESSLIMDFNIIATDIGGDNINIDLANGTNADNIIGYIICIGDKSIDVTKTLPYTITGLENNTQYNDIYVIAIDTQKRVKASCKLTVTTLKTQVLYDSATKNNILDSGFLSSDYRRRGCGGSRTAPTVNGHTMTNLGGSTQGTVYYKQLIDIGNYSSINFVISEARTGGYMPSILLTKANTIEDLYDYDSLGDIVLPTITQKTALTFDVSGLTGKRYLALFINAGSTLTVDKIELIK